MKKLFLSLCVSIGIAGCASHSKSAAVPASFEGFKQIASYEPLPGLKVYEYLHEASGLKVLIQPRVDTDVIAYVTAYDVGSRFEVQGKTGIAHLFEHMMFRGTPSFPEPFKTLSGWGDRFNAYTSFDLTLYHELVPKEVFGDLVKFESERMRQLQINETVFKTERGAVISERKMRTEDTPGGRLYWELAQAAFDTHPYQTGPIGWQEDLDATSFQDALAFYKRYYAPNRAVISIVGDVSVADALKTLHQYYGGFKREEWNEPKVPVENLKRKNRRVVLPMQSESVYMADGIFTRPLGDPQNAAEMLLCSLLADSKLGFLTYELVETKIARSVNDSCYFLVDPGLASIQIVGNPSVSVEKLETSYDKALKKFPAWMNAERLEGIKLFYLAYHLGELREPMDLAENLAFSAVTSKDPEFGFKFMDQIKGVTLDQVKAVWADWQTRSKTRVILKPAKKSAPFKRKLVRK
ncbi:MAG: pitrilysin family protein [Bdellovibrionota bacterium]